MYDEYGEVIMEDDGYYYSPHGPEVFPFLKCQFYISCDSVKNVKSCLNRLYVQFAMSTAVSTLCDIQILWLYHRKWSLN